ncbi:MAG: hypothetical protein ACKVJK_00475 [Methylophagaceae bacterium]
MADQNKFESMLEKLVNEDRAGAEELFHEIVVEKSRNIYEALLEDDLSEVEETSDEVEESADDEEDAVDEATDEEVDEDESEDVKEDFDLDEFEVEADPMSMEADPADDMMGDIEAGMDDSEDGDEEELEDRVVDLEDALDDLKSEFEKMIAGDEDEAGDEEESDDEEDVDGDEDDSEEESFNFEATEEEDEATDEAADEDKSEAEQMREYVEKVAPKMGDNGANTKSAIAGANDMGGKAGNIAQGGEESGRTADSAKEENAGTVNVPGAKASKSLKGAPKGHGAEKKSAGETADNKKSVVGK